MKCPCAYIRGDQFLDTAVSVRCVDAASLFRRRNIGTTLSLRALQCSPNDLLMIFQNDLALNSMSHSGGEAAAQQKEPSNDSVQVG